MRYKGGLDESSPYKSSPYIFSISFFSAFFLSFFWVCLDKAGRFRYKRLIPERLRR